jgi:signal transduction histidine kinase
MERIASQVDWPTCQYSPQVPCPTKQHADELETLLTIQQAITSHLDLNDVLQLIADAAQRLTSAQLSLLYVLEGDQLRIAAVSGQAYSDALLDSCIPVAQSVVGSSIQTGQPIMVADVQGSEGSLYLEAIEHFGFIHCYMTVPLLSGDRPIGAIAVADQDTAVLRVDSLRVLSMLAPSAVIGLENARLYQEQQERRLEAEGRHQMAESLRVLLAILNSNRSLDEILDYIVTHVSSRLLDCQAMAIYSLDPRDSGLAIQAEHGLSVNSFAAQYLPGHTAASQAVKTGKPVAVTNANVKFDGGEINPGASSAEWAMFSQLMVLYQAWLAVPLIVKGEVYGAILMYYRQPRQFSEEMIGLATVFSDQVALAIENARLRMQAEQAAVLAERNRLARELHDAVSQTLFSTALIADVLPRLWDRNQAEGRKSLEELRILTRSALAEMRTLLFELRPAALKEGKLGDLLKHLTTAISGRARIPIALTVQGDRTLPPEVQIALYRITQEALNNVIKHANPRQVSVTLSCHASGVDLDVCDDGCGFDPASVSSEHLGLGIMNERAAAIHAALSLQSKPGCGTRIQVNWSEPEPEEGV